jgi:hypothetical protein
MSKNSKKPSKTENNAAEPQDDPKFRARVSAIIQLAGGTAYSKELFGVSREAMKQFLAGPAVGRSHAGTLSLIHANVNNGSADKRAKEIAAERAKNEKAAASAKAESKKRASKKPAAASASSEKAVAS